jgi:hypothetical protein
MRILPVAIFCMAATCAWATQPNQTSQKKNPSTGKEQPFSTTTFIDNEQTNQTPSPTNESSPSFYAALKKPEWWLVFFALWTLYVINKQAREMAKATEEMKRSTVAVEQQADILERQTKAVEDSVELQKTLKRQWVNLQKWKLKGEEVNRTNVKSIFVEVSFDVTNPTEMLLQLRHVELFELEGGQVESPNISLSPTEPYRASFRVKLSEGQTGEYFGDLLKLTIFGNIDFKDNFGEKRSQTFGYICMGGITGTVFRQYDRWLNDDEED